MAAGILKERLVTLETRLDLLQRRVEEGLTPPAPGAKRGWQAIVGTFADDPLYEEAMRRAREWRENQHDEAKAG